MDKFIRQDATEILAVCGLRGPHVLPSVRQSISRDACTELDFQHIDVDTGETRDVREVIWASDNVELTTVG